MNAAAFYAADRGFILFFERIVEGSRRGRVIHDPLFEKIRP